jgi:aryl-alcohol dehydrogenase-like predicted oxidoreductase
MSFLTNWFKLPGSGGSANYDHDEDEDLDVPRRYFLVPKDSDDSDDSDDSTSINEKKQRQEENDYSAEENKYFDISALFVGLWECADQERLGNQPAEEEQVQALYNHVTGGLTTIDAADHYGNSESIISKFLEKHGSNTVIEICTKFCPKPGKMDFKTVESAIQKSLNNIFPSNMDDDGKIIDVLHFHWWSYSDTRYIDALSHLATLQERGWIRHIALTNFDAAHLRLVVASGLLVLWNQVHCSILDYKRSGSLMTQTCQSLSSIQTEPCKIVAYGALAGGFLTNRWYNVDEPSMNGLTWMQMKYKRFIDQWGGWALFQSLLKCLNDVANDINNEYEQSKSDEDKEGGGEGEGEEEEEEEEFKLNIANIALKFVEQLPHVSAVIVGARLGERDHIEGKHDFICFLVIDIFRLIFMYSLPL